MLHSRMFFTKKTSCGLLAVMFAAILLIGCSSPSDSSVVANAGESAEEGETATAIWVLAKAIETYKSDSGEFVTTYTFELDEHGNALKEVVHSEGEEPYALEYSYDEDGCMTSLSKPSDDGVDIVNYEVEKNANGLPTKSTSDSGRVREMTYDGSGNLVCLKMTAQELTLNEDLSTREVLDIATTDYGADGWPISHVRESESWGHTEEYIYEYDDNGRVTSYQNNCKSADDGTVYERAVTKVEYDENGNIARTIYESDSYSLVSEYLYEFVENPSAVAQVNSHIRLFGIGSTNTWQI